MAWDGSGNFSRTNGTQTGAMTWQDAESAGSDIVSDEHDTHDQDLADGIEACLTKNNESKPTADFKPNADASYSLGSSTLRWVNLFLQAIKLKTGTFVATVQSTNLTANRTVEMPDSAGTVQLYGASLAPTQITANQDDYAPTGHASAVSIRVSSDARRNITGLAGGADGRILPIHNIGTFPICFKYEDASSTAANRFAFGRTLGGGQSILIQYDDTTARWRLLNAPEEIGTIKDFGTSTMPEGFLAIDQNVSRTTYAALFNEIGTSFGAGDGSTTFGLYIGKGAALIAAGTGTQTESGVDADVDLTANTLAVASNNTKWITGMAVVFNLTSGTITGLSDDTTYYVIRNNSTTIKLASSLANAQNGTAIDLSAKSSPVWDITHTYTARTHGERLGEESHAISSTEALAHTHTIDLTTISTYDTGAGSSGPAYGSTRATSSFGGNTAMNNMQPSTVVTRGIRYC